MPERASSEGPHNGPDDPAGQRLDSWKEIAAYLKRGVTTVQRWEQLERLPVHRHLHDKRGSVYAFRAELDRWWQNGHHRLEEAVVEPNGPVPGPGTAVEAARRAARSARRVVVVAIIGLAGVVTVAVLARSVRSLRPPTRATTAELGLADELQNGPGPAVALSPDGRSLVYVAWRNGSDHLYLRPVGALQARAIPGTEHARSPFFSPDGRWIGFFADGVLKKTPLEGGPPVKICASAGTPAGATWTQDDTIVFSSFGTGLHQVPATGGEPKPITTPAVALGEVDHRWPAISPDGRTILFMVWSGAPDTARVAVQSLKTGQQRVLSRGTQPRWAGPSHVVFAWADGLWVAPFDARALETAGPSVRLVDSVRPRYGGAADYDIARDGSLVYVPTGSETQSTVVWVDLQGRTTTIIPEESVYSSPRLSPDGTRLALVVRSIDGAVDIWAHDLGQRTRAQLTTDGASFNPVWTPDGLRIVHASARAGTHGVYAVRADGTGTTERLLSSDWGAYPQSWSPGGRLLAYDQMNAANEHDIWLLSREGNRFPFRATTFAETWASFSPDGRSLAYAANDSGRYEVYVEPYPPTGRRLALSKGGGREPVWSPDGKVVYYRNLDGTALFRVAISAKPAFDAGSPSMLFDGLYEGVANIPGSTANYDIAPDGRRFVFLKREEEPPPRQVRVLSHWLEEFKHGP